MRKTLLILGVLFSTLFAANAAVYTISSGSNWTSLTSTWANVQDFDVVRIPAGVTLNINDANCDDLENVDVVFEVYGSLVWSRNGSSTDALYLSADSYIYLYNNGEVDAYSCSGKKQLYFGGTLTATCNGSSTTSSSTTYNTFGDIRTAGGIGANGPVPVTWLNYEAKEVNEGVQINWSTATELDNSHFEIEFSTDAENWVFVDMVTSKAENGRSEAILEYTYLHNMPVSGKVYYRIKQVDFDNDFEYTEVMAVEINNRPQVTIGTQGEGKVTLTSEFVANETVEVSVFDLSGNMITTVNITDVATLQLEKSKIYVFEFKKNNNVEVVKHFVQ